MKSRWDSSQMGFFAGCESRQTDSSYLFYGAYCGDDIDLEITKKIADEDYSAISLCC